MGAADFLASRANDILNEYRRTLMDNDSPLVYSLECWKQCSDQAEAILRECIDSLRGKSGHQPELYQATREAAVLRRLQHVPIAESIRAGTILWRVISPVLREALSVDSATEGESLASALEVLYQAISVRLYVGAVTYEATELALQVDGLESRPTPTEESGFPECLTRRERQVLNGASRALSNREIARELGISEATVKRHMMNIFGKLGAVSRVDAINKGGHMRRVLPFPFTVSSRHSERE